LLAVERERREGVFIEPLAAVRPDSPINLIYRKFNKGSRAWRWEKLAQLIARVLQAAGSRVVLYGKHADKLTLARRAGIGTKQVRGDASDLERVKENYRLVVEATGSPTGFALASG